MISSDPGSMSHPCLSHVERAGQVYIILVLITVPQLPATFSFGFLGPLVGFLCSNSQCLSHPSLELVETFCTHSVFDQGISQVSCLLPGMPPSFFSFLNLAPASCCICSNFCVGIQREQTSSVHSVIPVKDKFGYPKFVHPRSKSPSLSFIFEFAKGNTNLPWSSYWHAFLCFRLLFKGWFQEKKMQQ